MTGGQSLEADTRPKQKQRLQRLLHPLFPRRQYLPRNTPARGSPRVSKLHRKLLPPARTSRHHCLKGRHLSRPWPLPILFSQRLNLCAAAKASARRRHSSSATRRQRYGVDVTCCSVTEWNAPLEVRSNPVDLIFLLPQTTPQVTGKRSPPPALASSVSSVGKGPKVQPADLPESPSSSLLSQSDLESFSGPSPNPVVSPSGRTLPPRAGAVSRRRSVESKVRARQRLPTRYSGCSRGSRDASRQRRDVSACCLFCTSSRIVLSCCRFLYLSDLTQAGRGPGFVFQAVFQQAGATLAGTAARGPVRR